MSKTAPEVARRLAEETAAKYAAHDEVEAVALSGSLAAGEDDAADAVSDIDLYVYLNAELPMAARAEIAWASASYAEVGNTYWESGDEWICEDSEAHIDVTFRATDWIVDQVARVLERHEASVGYTTCLWHNVLVSVPLFDRSGWFERLQQAAQRPYPPQLQHAIVIRNHPILRETASSYRYQIAGAVRRTDRVSINHRVAALLASYFDIVFAVNELPHPGEKRLVQLAVARCDKLPEDMAAHLEALIGVVAADGDVLACVDALIDGLDALLQAERLLRG